MGSQVGWVCSFCSFSQAPWGKPATLSHTLLAPTLSHSSLNPSTSSSRSPPPAFVICSCFPAGSDNESDEEVPGKKSFSAQVSCCPPPPLPGNGSVLCSARLDRFPCRGKTSECQLVPVYWSICPTTGWSGPLAHPVPEDTGTASPADHRKYVGSGAPA